jgi:hypothetical protein
MIAPIHAPMGLILAIGPSLDEDADTPGGYNFCLLSWDAVP